MKYTIILCIVLAGCGSKYPEKTFADAEKVTNTFTIGTTTEGQAMEAMIGPGMSNFGGPDSITKDAGPSGINETVSFNVSGGKVLLSFQIKCSDTPDDCDPNGVYEGSKPNSVVLSSVQEIHN